MAGFTIPNSADALVVGQASPDSQDIQAMVAAHDLTGVLSGCAVTPSSGLILSVAAGIVIVSGTVATVAAGTVTVTAAHATLNRYDLVVVSSVGTKSVIAGTAAVNPVFPAITGALLAAVYVPALDTTIASNQIVDKRVLIRQPDEHLAYLYF